jgi:radical SAM protein with 4Fe4S-binding SPASM domain
MISLNSLSWIINNKCNLACIHCYPDSGCDTALDSESFQYRYKKYEDNFSKVRFDKVFISGGEPLLNENIFDYVVLAKKIALSEVNICTNGTLLTDDLAKQLKELGINRVVISLLHSDESKDKSIYGYIGVINKVKRAVNFCKNNELLVGLETTIIRKNYEDIDSIIMLAASLEVNTLNFKRFRGVGRGKINENQLSLSPKENYAVLNLIFTKSLEHKNIRFSVHDPLYNTVKYDYYEKLGYTHDNILKQMDYDMGCNAGVNWIGVDFHGNISPCPLMIYEDKIIGNIFKAPLDDILENSQLFTYLHTPLCIEDLQKCKYALVCRGCRTSTVACTGKICKSDPQCIFKEYSCPITNHNFDMEFSEKNSVSSDLLLLDEERLF